MDLTPENKAIIDGKTYPELLRHWRFAKIGDPWFQGETGDYWAKRIGEEREKIGSESAAEWSKRIGWEV